MAALFLLLVLPQLMALSESSDTPYIDMTYTLGPATLRIPTRIPFKWLRRHKGAWGPGGRVPYVEDSDFSTAEHQGTHIDAPAHFSKREGIWHLHEIPVENFVGPAVVIDIKDRAAKNKDAEVMAKDLQDWEEKHGRIPKGAIILMDSGWGKYWGNNTLFRGSDTDDLDNMHFPGFSVEAAQWILDNRPDIAGIGTDTFSLEYGPSKTGPVHKMILEKNIFGLEMVANTEKIPVSGALLYVLPMKILDGSGAPVRILAVKDGYTSKGVVGAALPYLMVASILVSLISTHL